VQFQISRRVRPGVRPGSMYSHEDMQSLQCNFSMGLRRASEGGTLVASAMYEICLFVLESYFFLSRLLLACSNPSFSPTVMLQTFVFCDPRCTLFGLFPHTNVVVAGDLRFSESSQNTGELQFGTY